MKIKITMILSVFALTFFSISNFSCKDKCKEAGTGGAVTIAAFAKHHTWYVYGKGIHRDTAFVKFNTRDFPGTNASAYDLVLEGDSGEDHVHIENLKCGDYYIYVRGFDDTINKPVTGGIPYSIPESSPTAIDLDVPVSE